MAESFAEQLTRIRAARAITDDEVLELRRAFYADADITADEAEALMQVDELVAAPSPAWAAFYVEALTDHLVSQRPPQGFVDQDKADWLQARVLRDGRIRRPTELELVIHVLETARGAPDSLSAFALAQAKASMLAHVAAGGATDEDVERLRRVVFAYAGASDISITRAEAEALFDLNDALRGEPQPPAWRDFFVKAIANAVMAAHTVRTETRAEQAALEAPAGHGLSAFLDNLARAGRDWKPGLAHVFDPAIDPERLYAERNAQDDAVRAQAEVVTGEEARWLIGRIGRDGTLDDNETALVAYLRELSPQAGQALMG
jgi:hypothetical protein